MCIIACTKRGRAHIFARAPRHAVYTRARANMHNGASSKLVNPDSRYVDLSAEFSVRSPKHRRLRENRKPPGVSRAKMTKLLEPNVGCLPGNNSSPVTRSTREVNSSDSKQTPWSTNFSSDQRHFPGHRYPRAPLKTPFRTWRFF